MPSTTHQPADKGRAIFLLHLIKPSHYDDDGYVIQWLRSDIPSNTLAALYGIARDCDERQVLGEQVEIRISVHDETNLRVAPDKIITNAAAKPGDVLFLTKPLGTGFVTTAHKADRCPEATLAQVMT